VILFRDTINYVPSLAGDLRVVSVAVLRYTVRSSSSDGQLYLAIAVTKRVISPVSAVVPKCVAHGALMVSRPQCLAERARCYISLVHRKLNFGSG
jgi:hypothetical protein